MQCVWHWNRQWKAEVDQGCGEYGDNWSCSLSSAVRNRGHWEWTAEACLEDKSWSMWCHAHRCLSPRQSKQFCKPLRQSLYKEQKEQQGDQNERGGGSGGRGQRPTSHRVTWKWSSQLGVLSLGWMFSAVYLKVISLGVCRWVQGADWEMVDAGSSHGNEQSDVR